MNALANTKKKSRLGEELLAKGLATQDQIEIALTEQKKNGNKGQPRTTLFDGIGHFRASRTASTSKTPQSSSWNSK